MRFQLSTQILPALSAIVAALVAAALSFVNLTLSKEQKTSEFRQKWIDGLRDDLAAYFSSARAFARATEAERLEGDSPFDAKKTAEFRHTAAEAFYKVKLRLNPIESDHQYLMGLLDEVNRQQNFFLSGAGDSVEKVLQAIDAASDFSIPVLKSEWRRVKDGELPFRLARNILAPSVVFVSIAFLVLLFVAV